MSRPAAPAVNPFRAQVPGAFSELAPGVHLWRSIVNSTVVVGRDAIAVIDTQVNRAAAGRLLAAIRARFRQPIRWAVNTHYHWDHTNGNQVFADAGAVIVQGERTIHATATRQDRQKAFLRSRGFDLDPDPRPHDRTAEELGAIDLGGVTIELHRGHDAETADPTLAWVRESRVLCAGDTVMTGSFPILGQPNQREGFETEDWFAALAQVRGFGPAVIAPGHGPAADAGALDLFERTLRWIRDATVAEHAAGRPLAEAIARIEATLPDWIRAMPEIWGTPRYAVLRVWCGLTDLGEPGFMHAKPPALPAARGPMPAAADIAGWRAAGDQALEGGDPGLAAACAAVLRERWPDDADALTAAADLWLQASRSLRSVLEKGDCLRPALDALDRAIAIEPGHGRARIARARSRILPALRSGDPTAGAEADLDRAADDHRLDARGHAEIHWLRGLARRVRGDEDGAAACLRRALRSDPAFAPAALALR
jgi:cyclase